MMIDREFPKTCPKALVRLGAERYTFRTDTPGGYDPLIAERKLSAEIG
ncbi:MAG: hypothetical protein ACOVP2_00035 [Armatimonadaceae bacterium]